MTKRDFHGRSKYWSFSVGWTWLEHADVFTNYDREHMLLPPDGVWEEVQDY